MIISCTSHLHGVVRGLGHVEDGGHLVQSRLVDVADHDHLGLGGHGSHGGAVAAADASHPDDSDLSVERCVRTTAAIS